jgi:hypothetical protein
MSSRKAAFDESPFINDAQATFPKNTNSASQKKKRGPLSHITSFMSPQSLSFSNEQDNAVQIAFPWQQILFANLAFAGVALLLYGTYCMFSSFFIPLLWGTIVALLLREVRSSLEIHLISLKNRWNCLHAWASPPDAVFALQLIAGGLNFVAGIVPECILRFISFAFCRKHLPIAADSAEFSRSRVFAAQTPERHTFEPGGARGRSQRKPAMSTHRSRPRSPAKVEMNYRNASSYRHHMVVLVRISCSWLLGTSLGLAFGVIAVSAIVVFQAALKNIASPLLGSHIPMVVYISLIFNRFCFFATFVGAIALLTSGSSTGVLLMLYIITVLVKNRIQIILKFIPLQSVVLVLIFFITTVIFVIASYLTLWNVYHELQWMYNGARDGLASYLQFLPSEAVDVLSQQFVQWSNFSSISNAALDFFKNDLSNGNMSRLWAEAERLQNISSSAPDALDPVALLQTYLGPSVSWIPESVLVWVAPLAHRLHDGVHMHGLYSQVTEAYNQLTSYGYVTSVLSYAKAMFLDFSGYSFAFFLSILLQSVSQMYNAFVFIAIFLTSSWYTTAPPPLFAFTFVTFLQVLSDRRRRPNRLLAPGFQRHAEHEESSQEEAGRLPAAQCAACGGGHAGGLRRRLPVHMAGTQPGHVARQSASLITCRRVFCPAAVSCADRVHALPHRVYRFPLEQNMRQGCVCGHSASTAHVDSSAVHRLIRTGRSQLPDILQPVPRLQHARLLVAVSAQLVCGRGPNNIRASRYHCRTAFLLRLQRHEDLL